MGLRKSKNDIGDISDVMEQIGKENEMKEKTSELDLRLQKMESTIAKLTLVEQQISVTHREANHCLEKLNSAIAETRKTLALCQEHVVYMKEKVVLRAKVDTADIEKINGLCRKMVQDEQTLLEKHARARKIEIQNYKGEVRNLVAEGGIWLSSYWMKALIIFFVGYTGVWFLYFLLK